MRAFAGDDHFRVKAIAGTHVVLMALDMDAATRAGLRGFAIKRGQGGEGGQPPIWLRGIKYFKDLIAQPNPEDDYSSREQPFQSFLWSDYRASPGTEYDFTIVALYGDIHALEERHTLTFKIRTEPEYDDKGQGVWFNRGAIASHAFEKGFHNQTLTDTMTNNVSDDGKLLDPETQWLSRGLAEACLKYINDTQRGEGLRVSAYEFTYLPVLKALKRAHDRGVDVEIVYHDTKKPKDENRAAIAQAGLPDAIVHPRTRTAIPHNKFIVKLAAGKPQRVWTGSTNFTDSGFYGQTNVGHVTADPGTVGTYLQYWEELKDDPVHSAALANATRLTPNPPNVIAKSSVVPFFSPRVADNMLDWYGQRIDDTGSLAMMTIPFNVADKILAALARKSDAMRLVILEDPPSPAVTAAENNNRGKLAFSNGAVLGKSFIKYSAGGAKVTPIPNSDLDKWFVDEELDRPTNQGHVFFVHAKVLIVDPLSDDPLVCSGSANFSANSLTANDENMLLIRGDTRVADIYMTELDRIFRHFWARDIINRSAAEGDRRDWLLLDTTDGWIGANFTPGDYKNNRRLLFFPDVPPKPWSVAAGADPDPFADEAARAAGKRAATNEKAKARRSGDVTPASTKTAKTGKEPASTAASANKPATPDKTSARSTKRPSKTSRKTSRKTSGKKAGTSAGKNTVRKTAKKTAKETAKKIAKKAVKKTGATTTRKSGRKAGKKSVQKRANKAAPAAGRRTAARGVRTAAKGTKRAKTAKTSKARAGKKR
jgi:phosphatidylserine/phosphatidylglycerophosphate/cardiolipin synthase-like enzyme